MKILFTLVRSIIFAAAFAFLWAWVALGLRDRYDATLAWTPPGWVRLLGIVVMILGGALAIACVGTFIVRGEGTPAPFDPPRKFVAVGPYKRVRNPMYIGAFALLLGFGFYEKSPAILLFTLPWLLAAHLFAVLYEEPHLRSTFGAPYDAYYRSVPRWLPRFR